MNKAKNIKGFCAKAEKYISGLKEIFGEQGGFFQNKSFQKKTINVILKVKNLLEKILSKIQ